MLGLRINRWGGGSNYHYGVERQKSAADPAFYTLIGEHLHNTLPVQNAIAPVKVNESRRIVGMLNPVNWNYNLDGTPSLLDGSDGTDVMIYYPGGWMVVGGTDPDYEYYLIGNAPFSHRGDDAIYIAPFFDVPCTCTLQASTGKLRSVRNETADFAGTGSNYTVGGLGYPRTYLSRYQFEQYARAKGNGWRGQSYPDLLYQLCLLFIEFKTKNLKSIFGPGPSNWSDGNWNYYNGYRPVMKMMEPQIKLSGTPAILQKGHMTGIYTQTFIFNNSVPEQVTYNTQFPVWRGKRLNYGEIWNWYSDIDLEVQSDADGGKTNVYVNFDRNNQDANWSDSNFAFRDNNVLAGEAMRVSGWAKDLIAGTYQGATTGGGETTYACAYNWHSIPASGISRRGVLFGANLSGGGYCAPGSAYARYAPSHAYATVGGGFRADVPG